MSEYNDNYMRYNVLRDDREYIHEFVIRSSRLPEYHLMMQQLERLLKDGSGYASLTVVVRTNTT